MNELKLLFTTNFSDSCFRAIRAVAQMADAFPLSVTIANVCESPKSNLHELNSFFAEADHYSSCRRVTLRGKPAEAIAAYTRKEHFDMIIAPGSDRIGIPRPFHRSLRSSLLRQGAAPIWTTSRGLEEANFRRPIRTIAVGIDGSDNDLTHLNLAASFAGRIDAKLRLLTVVPAVSEGTLITQAISPQPLHPSVALERIEYLLRGWGQVPTVDVAIGSSHQELQRMAARCDADLLFLNEAQSSKGLIFRHISNTVNNSPCAVISIPSSLPARFKWSFQPKRHAEAVAELEAVCA